MSPISAVVDTIKAMSEEILSLREQVAALESREVCTVAHENVETCGYCQRDALAAENAALRAAAGKVPCPGCGRPFSWEPWPTDAKCAYCTDLRALLGEKP